MLRGAVKYSVLISFTAGLIVGIVFYRGILWKSGLAVIDQQAQPYPLPDEEDLPYAENVDARAVVKLAREKALRDGKFLMVTFGANWCFDCRTLYHRLNSAEVADYSERLFDFVNVNVGKFNQNADVAADLGVKLTKGIPVAIFFDSNGEVIGTTNEGQLEPARRYSSKQILNFMRNIAEQSRILAPDAVR